MKISEFLTDYEYDCREELITLMLEPERNNRKVKLLTAYIAKLEAAIHWQKQHERRSSGKAVVYGEEL